MSAALETSPQPKPAAAKDERPRAVPILARSLFRDLLRNGFEAAHLVALSTELIALTASMLRERREAAAECAVVELDSRREP